MESMNKETFKKEFELLSNEDQYRALLAYEDKSEIYLVLDNDVTFVHFEGEEEYFVFDSDLGDSEGVFHLLEAIGIKAQYC